MLGLLRKSGANFGGAFSRFWSGFRPQYLGVLTWANLWAHFVPVASRRERSPEGDDFPCTFSGLGNAPSQGKSREITLIFCNGIRFGSVGGKLTDHPQFTVVFAGFWVSAMRLDSCNELGNGGWGLKASLEGLRSSDERDVKR